MQQEEEPESVTRLREARRVAEESSVTATAALAALQAQNDQLRGASKKMDSVNENLTYSEKLLKGMKSWTYAIFTKKPTPPAAQKSSDTTSTATTQPPPLAFHRTPLESPREDQRIDAANSNVSSTTKRAMEDEELDALASTVGRLKEQGRILGSAIEEGDELVDELATKVDNENSRFKRVNRTIKTIK